MAYYAIVKRIRRKNFTPYDVISWYTKYLHQLWWDSLPEEEKIKIEEERAKRKRDLETFFSLISYMYRNISNPFS